MSTGLKEKLNSWFVRAVVIFLALTFIVGLGYTGGLPWSSLATGVAAEINGDSVPLSYYQFVRRQIHRAQTENLDRVPVELQDAIDRAALSFLIERKLLAQEAFSLGLRFPDEEVGKAITGNSAFRPDGEFAGTEYYRRVVRRVMGLTVSQFENSIRDEGLVLKMVALSRVSSRLSEPELSNLFNLTGAKIKVDYIPFDSFSEAQEAFEEFLALGDIDAVAEKFSKQPQQTQFFTPFEIPDPVESAGTKLFTFPLQSRGAAIAVSPDGGVYSLAVVSGRKKADSAALTKKVQIAMSGADKTQDEILRNWVNNLYLRADVETSGEILR